MCDRRRTGRRTRSASPVRAAAGPGAGRAPRRGPRRAPASADAVAICPPIRAELLPSAATVRARTTSPSSAHSSASGPGVEPGLHARRVRRRRAPARPGPPAEREGEPHRHHGLARAGLSRQDVEAGMQLEVEVIDHAESTDVQLPEHGPDTSRGRRHRGRPGKPELLAHEREESRRAVPSHEARRAGGGADPDPRAHGQLQTLASVGGEQPRLVALHLERDLLRRVQDEGAVEHHVRGDRRQHQALDARASRSAPAPRRSTPWSPSASPRSRRRRRTS